MWYKYMHKQKYYSAMDKILLFVTTWGSGIGEHHFLCSPSNWIAQEGTQLRCSSHLADPPQCALGHLTHQGTLDTIYSGTPQSATATVSYREPWKPWALRPL